MFTVRDLLLGAALPGLVAAATLFAGWRPWRREEHGAGGWLGSLAVCAGYGVAFAALRMKLPIPPREAADWTFYFAIAAAALAAIYHFANPPPWPRRLAALLLILAACSLLIYPLAGIDQARKAGWIIALTLIVTAWWEMLERFARSEPGASVPALLSLFALAASMVLLMSGSKWLGQLAGSVAATSIACSLIGFFARNRSLDGGGVLCFVVLVSSLLICGLFYAELTRMNAALLCIAALSTGAGAALPDRNIRGWQRQTVLALLILVPCAAAAILAAMDFAASMNETGAY